MEQILSEELGSDIASIICGYAVTSTCIHPKCRENFVDEAFSDDGYYKRKIADRFSYASLIKHHTWREYYNYLLHVFVYPRSACTSFQSNHTLQEFDLVVGSRYIHVWYQNNLKLIARTDNISVDLTPIRVLIDVPLLYMTSIEPITKWTLLLCPQELGLVLTRDDCLHFRHYIFVIFQHGGVNYAVMLTDLHSIKFMGCTHTPAEDIIAKFDEHILRRKHHIDYRLPEIMYTHFDYRDLYCHLAEQYYVYPQCVMHLTHGLGEVSSILWREANRIGMPN